MDHDDPGRADCRHEVQALLNMLDYVQQQMRTLSPMTAYLIAMAKDNLKKEFLSQGLRDRGEAVEKSVN